MHSQHDLRINIILVALHYFYNKLTASYNNSTITAVLTQSNDIFLNACH